jgi:glycerol-3-phosphate acyltransferase PlsY
MVWLIAIFPLAYLLGSIPSSVWLGKALRGIDLREHGSGNAGATNAFRVLGKPIGVAVLVMDMGKGFLAVYLSRLQHLVLPGTESMALVQVVLGLLAVIGHLYPLFARFRGGKGVATLAGVGLAIHPLAAFSTLGTYLAAFMVSGISAVGSLVAVVTYPFWIMAVFRSEYKSFWVFSIVVPILVILTHRNNIKRLIKKE